MKPLFLPLLSLIVLPVLICSADVIPVKDNANVRLQPGMINKQNLKSVPSIDLPKITVTRFKSYESPSESAIIGPTPNSKYAAFLSQVSPEYKVKRNFLSLTKISTDKHRRAFVFVFLMNNKETARNNKDKERTRMHVMWTGSKKVMKEQKIIKNEYPIDFSIANYEDGYAPGEWNFILPNKKPREVRVSLMWAF